MNVRELTEGLMHIDVEIKAKELEYEEQKTRCTKVNQELEEDRVQTTRNLHRQEEENAKLVQIGLELDELRSLTAKAKELYGSLSDRRYTAILVSRYINTMSWGEIRKLIGCSRTSVFRLHSEAIDELKSKIIQKRD